MTITFNEERIEQIARRYCVLRGEDPDERVGHSIAGSGMWHLSARWNVVAVRIRDEMTMQAAMFDTPESTLK